MENFSNVIHELSIQIKGRFQATLKDESEDMKWSLLKDYSSKYLLTADKSVLLSSYHCVLSSLIDSLRPTLFTKKHHEALFDELFLNGIHHEAFMILVRRLNVSSESYQQQKILKLLEKFLHCDCLVLLITHQCSCGGPSDLEYITLSAMWSDLIMLISSLPERVANKTKGRMSKIFHVDNFLALVSSAMLKSMSLLHQRITQELSCSLAFIGQLVGKLCTLGHGDTIARVLCMGIVQQAETDFIWRRMSHSMISKIPFMSLEPFVTSLLLTVPWYGYVDWILGDEGSTNERLNYILTTKLPLMRHFAKVMISQNIIGYFASSSYRILNFWKILRSLVNTWSDASALKYQSLEQQVYIASALVICSGWLHKIQDTSQSKDFVPLILSGTMIRNGSSEADVRNMGMIVSSFLIPALDPDMEKFTNQEIENGKLYLGFKKLADIPSDPGKDSLFSEDFKFLEIEPPTKESKTKLEEEKLAKTFTDKLGVESDDDLEPYDLSNDLPSTGVGRPYYLRDCLQGLIEHDKEEWFEQCLKYAEELIEANVDSVHEVAVEMAKVLLHLDDPYNTPDFTVTRSKILVTLTVHSPVLVSDYLISQFYAENYVIRQRLDILEVLTTASLQFSQPKTAPSIEESTSWKPKSKTSNSTDKLWKTVIEDRVAAKTRHITKTRKIAAPEMLENRFSAVAGYFFFPLLAGYDKQNKMLKLFGEDSFVLGRLIYTLAVVVHAASNLPMSPKMGRILLEFLVDVRNHSDVFVREATIFALGAVYYSVPSYLLFSDEMAPHVLDSQQWLQSVVDKDTSTNCQIRASCVLSLIVGIMKEEMPLFCEILSTKCIE